MTTNADTIGMMTFHASHNNGSMLQALALQHILENHFHQKTELIDFSNQGQRNMYAPVPKPKNWKQAIKSLIWSTNMSQMKHQYDSYEAFKKRYFHMSSDTYSSIEELKPLAYKYKAFITGSDQVWNIKCIDADDAYYLSFVKDRPKFAYAVSFGANNPFILEGDTKRYENYLEHFDKISVREKNAQKWIKEATGVEVPICLDPSMLLNESEWEQLVDVGDTPVISGDYIFYYCFSITEEVQHFLKSISKKTGMPVYFMEAKEWTLKMCWRNDIRLIRSYGPDVYMNVVKHAKLFVTSSFHGTAFGTIYRKNFWYIRSKHSESSLDDRASSFLTQLGLMSRYRTIAELSALDLFEPVDYTQLPDKLEPLRIHSFEYLQSVVDSLN